VLKSYHTISNKHLKSSRLSEAKFRDLVMYFSADLEIHKVTFKTGLNRNTRQPCYTD